MKKILVVLFAVLVVGVLWFGTQSQKSEAQTQPQPEVQKEKVPIVKTYKDEGPDAGADNSLSTAIYNTSLMANNIAGPTSQINLDTLVRYEEGALEWANKVNASEEIKSKLRESIEYTKQGMTYEAADVLSKLNYEYNNGNPHFKEEKTKIDSSLANGIHKTAVLFDRVADPNESFSFDHSDIQTVLDYEKTTIDIANHTGTPKPVIDYLNSALELTEQGISEKNVNKIHQAREKILELEFQFNKPKEGWKRLE